MQAVAIPKDLQAAMYRKENSFLIRLDVIHQALGDNSQIGSTLFTMVRIRSKHETHTNAKPPSKYMVMV
jgi:hypothetical protein